MPRSQLSGWPVVLLSSLMAVLILSNLAVFAYRQGNKPRPVSSQESRIAALEAQVAALKAEKPAAKPDPMSRYRAVYQDGQFVGFKEGNPLIRGISVGGYSERPVGE